MVNEQNLMMAAVSNVVPVNENCTSIPIAIACAIPFCYKMEKRVLVATSKKSLVIYHGTTVEDTMKIVLYLLLIRIKE